MGFFSIYRPPTQSQPYFLGQLSTAIDHFSDKYENFVVVGDFNALEMEQEIGDFMDLFAFKNLVKANLASLKISYKGEGPPSLIIEIEIEPACFKSGNPRCIDLILTSRGRNFQQTMAIETGPSDFREWSLPF